MFINGLGTALPPNCYRQADCWKAFEESPVAGALNPRSRAIVRKVLNANNGIETRHLVLNSLSEAFNLDADTLHQRFIENAPVLASQAATRALANSGLAAKDMDAVLVSTCTGYLCPGLTSYVSERLGLRPDALLLDLVGQGCGAALPNLRTAEALLLSGRYKKVLSICVEVCSAALYFDNDPGVLISACLFGDGAGAAVLSMTASTNRKIEWKNPGTTIACADRDLLKFEQRGGLLRNILAAEVPALAARHAGKLLGQMLADAEVNQRQINGWVLHPGGRDILAALREKLGLSVEDTRWSQEVLRRCGNLSSPSVFFVLETAFQDSAKSGLWWMSSFGAGFSCHGVLLDVEV
jgi:alkylresorcinol/alkylpyrone synthase